MPYFISSVVVAGMVLSFLNADGVLNQILAIFNVPPKAYNTLPKAFPIFYTVTCIWKSFGWGSILYLSTISSIDPGLYESAKIDGANRLQRCWYVTLPHLSNLIIIQLIFSIGGLLGSNTELILLLYVPATYSTADVIGTYVYRDGLMGRTVQLRHRCGHLHLDDQLHLAVHHQQDQHQGGGLRHLVMPEKGAFDMTTTAPRKRNPNRIKDGSPAATVVLYALSVLICIATLYPMYYVVIKSISDPQISLTRPGHSLSPRDCTSAPTP